MPLVDVTGGASPPNTLVMASASARSLRGVDVPWALIWPMSPRVTPASSMASTADAHHITAPIPGGAGATACMVLAMEDAGVTLGDIGHINAHGTSTPINDRAAADALTKVFGGDAPPVTSTKGITGHGLGAAGALS